MSEGKIAYIKPVSIDTLSSKTTNEPLSAFLALNQVHDVLVGYIELHNSDRKCSSFTVLISIGRLSPE